MAGQIRTKQIIEISCNKKKLAEKKYWDASPMLLTTKNLYQMQVKTTASNSYCIFEEFQVKNMGW
jgi:hypothetical protein